MISRRQNFTVRAAFPADADEVLEMLRALAASEGSSTAPRMDQAALQRDVFSAPPKLNILVAESHLASRPPQLVGFLTWYPTYSSWEGSPGVHVGDLYVRESFRGQRIASRLLEEVFQQTNGRVDVFVASFNAGARAFYLAMGLEASEDWLLYRKPPAYPVESEPDPMPHA